MTRAGWCWLGLLLIPTATAGAQAANSGLPRHLTIARHTFIDVGPPNDFYEIIQVDQASEGLEVQRVSVTPRGIACVQPSTVEYSFGTLHETMNDLLQGQNPCSISAKALRRERKRCRHCMVFSGADVTLQLECAGSPRRIDMDVLDRDWFDANPGTPRYTSWTMAVLKQLDSVIGPGVLDRPMFPVESSSPPPPASNSLVQEVQRGVFDALFGNDVKVSQIALDAKQPIPSPTIQIEAVEPATPLSAELPNYPPIARFAHVEGLVTAAFKIDNDGRVGQITFPDGPKLGMLQTWVAATLPKWRFPPSAAGKSGRVSIRFKLNCDPADRTSSGSS